MSEDPGNPRSRPRAGYGRLLAGILLLGLLLRVAVYLDLRANDPLFFTPVLDSRVYLDWAARIAGGDLLGDRVFFLNPLYAYCLAPVTLVAGSETLFLTRVLQMALGLGTVLLVAGAVRRLLSRGPALLAALLAAVYPVMLFYEQMVMIAALAVFLNALSLYMLARLREKRTVRDALLAGLPLGFAILARPNVAPFVLLLPLWLIALGRPGRRLRFAAARSAALIGAAVLVILPVTLRNWRVGHDFVPVTSSAGVNLYMTNNPKAAKFGRMDSPEDLHFGPRELERDSRRIAEAAEGRELRPSEVSAYWTKRALDYIKAEPGRASLFLLRKLFFFLQSPEFPSSHHYGTQREESAILPLLPLDFGLLSPLALYGLIVVVRRRREGIPFVLLFLVYAAGLAAFFPLGHYRAPVLPAVYALSALGALSALSGVRAHGMRSAARPLALIALLFLFVNSTRILRAAGVESLTGYADAEAIHAENRGRILLRNGHVHEAERWLLEAISRGGDRGVSRLLLSEVKFQKGREQQVRGRWREALAEYEAAEEYGAPVWIVARQSWCLRRLGRYEEALRRIEAALPDHPGDGPLNMEKAYCLVQLRPDLVEEIRSAVRAAERAGLEAPADLRRRLER